MRFLPPRTSVLQRTTGPSLCVGLEQGRRTLLWRCKKQVPGQKTYFLHDQMLPSTADSNTGADDDPAESCMCAYGWAL